jgi:hypothetical protein
MVGGKCGVFNIMLIAKFNKNRNDKFISIITV